MSLRRVGAGRLGALPTPLSRPPRAACLPERKGRIACLSPPSTPRARTDQGECAWLDFVRPCGREDLVPKFKLLLLVLLVLPPPLLLPPPLVLPPPLLLLLLLLCGPGPRALEWWVRSEEGGLRLKVGMQDRSSFSSSAATAANHPNPGTRGCGCVSVAVPTHCIQNQLAHWLGGRLRLARSSFGLRGLQRKEGRERGRMRETITAVDTSRQQLRGVRDRAAMRSAVC